MVSYHETSTKRFCNLTILQKHTARHVTMTVAMKGAGISRTLRRVENCPCRSHPGSVGGRST